MSYFMHHIYIHRYVYTYVLFVDNFILHSIFGFYAFRFPERFFVCGPIRWSFGPFSWRSVGDIVLVVVTRISSRSAVMIAITGTRPDSTSRLIDIIHWPHRNKADFVLRTAVFAVCPLIDPAEPGREFFETGLPQIDSID